MSNVFRHRLHQDEPEDGSSQGTDPNIARRFVIISSRSNGSWVDERLLAVTFVALDNLEIGEPLSWSNSASRLNISADHQRVVDTSPAPSTTSLVDVSSWFTTGSDARLTFIGHDVSASIRLLTQELLGANLTLPPHDDVDISSIAEAADVNPSSSSVSSLLDSLDITNLAPGSTLGECLALATATLALMPLLGVVSERIDGQVELSNLVETSVAARKVAELPDNDHDRRRTSSRVELIDDIRDSEKFPSSFLRVFFAVYFVLGLGLIALFPPFQSADAFAHFDRAVGISTGQIVTSTVKGFSGSELPASVFQAEVPFTKIPFNPAQRVDQAEFDTGYAQLWKSPPSFTAYSTGAYLPFLYAPQVLGVWIGKLVSNHVLVSSYLAELMNLLAFVALTMWALSQFPKRIALALGAILLLPTVSSLATSVNPDAMFIALSFVFAASVYNRYRDFREQESVVVSPRHSRRTRGAFLLPSTGRLSTRYHFAYVSLFFMVIEKPPYIVLALLLPIADFYSDLRRYVTKVAIFVAASLAVYGVWTIFGAHGSGGPSVGFKPSPLRQIEYVTTHPFFYVKVVFETFRWGGWAYIQEFLAGIGWLDVRFPNWLYEGISLIVVVLIMSGALRRRDSRWRFLSSLFVLFLAFQAIFLSFYIFYCPYQWPLIDGFQGRYAIPLVPILIVLFGLDRRRAPRLRAISDAVVGQSDLILVSLELLVACEFFMTLLSRYWN